jgi:hypothetical protein
MRSGSVMSSSGNQARRCLFCEADSPLSREHVWPRWIATLLPEGHRFSSRGTVGRYGGQPRAQFGEVFESVDSCSWTARVVCDSCNSGWMSTLESAAQPILGPLLTGKSETIRGTDLTVAFRWAVKTAITIGAGTGNPWRLEPRQAQALRDGKAPRIISRVSLAQVPEGLDGWAHVERLRTKVAGRPGALFVEAVRGHLALSVGIAPLLEGLPAWHVLMPPEWASLDSPSSDTTLPEIELAQVWGVSLARLKLLTMVGQADFDRSPIAH